MADQKRISNDLSRFFGVMPVENLNPKVLTKDDVQEALGHIIKQQDSVDKLNHIRPGPEAKHAQTVLMECTATVSDIIRPVNNELSTSMEDNPASSIRLS